MILSIMGMYEYDQTIFNGLTVPTGVDRNALINEILLECAELEIVYPNIDTMKLAITVWSVANQYTWEKLYKTTQLTYNPIWNVDATETEQFGQGRTHELTHGHKDTRTADLTTERTPDLTNERTPNLTDERTPDLTNTKSVKGFNTTSWAEAEKNAETGTDTTTHTGTDTVTETGTDTITESGTDTHEHSGKDTISERIDNGTTRVRTGNIGVTTTQKMITEERDIAQFSIINYIVQSFKERFCILIY